MNDASYPHSSFAIRKTNSNPGPTETFRSADHSILVPHVEYSSKKVRSPSSEVNSWSLGPRKSYDRDRENLRVILEIADWLSVPAVSEHPYDLNVGVLRDETNTAISEQGMATAGVQAEGLV